MKYTLKAQNYKSVIQQCSCFCGMMEYRKVGFKNLKMVENQMVCTLMVLKKGEVNISISFHVKSNVQLRS